MRANTALMYYMSQNLVDQIYIAMFGEIASKIVRTEKGEFTTGGKAKIGLSNILTALGLSAEGEINLANKSDKSKSLELIPSVHDRMKLILEVMFDNFIKDIKEISSPENRDDLYTFTLYTNISHSFMSRNAGEKSFIEVSHKSDKLQVSGLTSQDNWVAPSLLNTLIWESAKTGGVGIQTSGIILPLSISSSSGTLSISGQYLVIGNMLMFHENTKDNNR